MATILIIDDDAAVRAVVSRALKAAGHEAFSAENGNTGLRYIPTIRPDLVIVDLFMPEKEGLEIIVELRKKFPRVSVLAISGDNIASAEMLEVALKLGATHALEKPFDQKTLFAAVDKALGGALKLYFNGKLIRFLPETHENPSHK